MAICSYNSTQHTAKISEFTSDDLPKYLARLFAEHGLLQGKGMLTIPWISFVNKLNQLQEYEDFTGEHISYVGEASNLIEKAQQAISDFHAGLTSGDIDHTEIQSILESRGFKRELKPYQVDNVHFLVSRRAGATFSVPGAGKTTEALAYFTLVSEPQDELLVISPINAFSAWDDEIQGCYDDQSLLFTRIDSTRQSDVAKILNSNSKRFIVNYDKLDKIKQILFDYMVQNRVIVFLDESHYIKSEFSIRTKAALSIAQLPAAKLILTGTPLPNGVVDLISQMKFLYPEVHVEKHDVVEKVRSIYVRTTRPQLDIPNGIFTPVVVPLPDSLRCIHRVFQNDIVRNVNYESATAISRIKRNVMYLLQLTSNPFLLLDVIMDIPFFPLELLEGLSSPKIDYVCDRVRSIVADQEKVVIWSMFRKNIITLQYRLQDLNSKVIMGGIDSTERGQSIKDFNNSPDCNVIIINPAAGSEGISLHHNCHRAIYVDRSFNAVHWLQSQDRIRRIGQSKNPQFELLVHPLTIDDRVNLRLDEKINRMQSVLNDQSINVEKEPLSYVDDGDIEKRDDFGIDMSDIRYLVKSFNHG
jgi:SNF2 family DNA or RNA helicase